MLKDPEERQPAVVWHGSLLRFGDFLFDIDRHGLYRGGERIHLTGKPLETLEFLLKNAGRVVTKHELLDAVWKDVFVTENSLEHAIAEIRRVLGDDKEDPRFIQTVPRQGYRFVARTSGEKGVSGGEVIDVQDSPSRESQPRALTLQIPLNPRPLTRTLSTRRWSRRRLVLGFCIFVLIGVLAIWFRPTQPLPRVLHSTQITNSSSVKLAPIVTDGSRLYFMEMRSGRYALAQVSAAGGESVSLPTPFPNVYLCDISTDRSKLLIRSFNSFWREEGPLWLLPVTGGSPQRLGTMRAFDGSWSPDGQIAYTTGRDVYVARSDGSEPRKLLGAAGEPWWPRWSPDGSRLRFTVFDPQKNTNSLWEYTVRTGDFRPLRLHGDHSSAECCGNWTPDNTYFLFQSSSGNRVDAIHAIRERSQFFHKIRREPVQLTSGPVNFRGPVPSKDGNRFAKGTLLRAELVRYEARSRLFGTFLPGTSVETLDVSRDGNWLAYTTLPEGLLWRSRADGLERLQLTFVPLRAALPAWSPDGERVAFMGRVLGQRWKIYVVSAKGGNIQPLMQGEQDEADPGWSPDGNSLVFGRLAVNPSPAIHLVDLKTGDVTKLPGSEGLFSPRWSPDGRRIAALRTDAGKLVVFDFATQKWTDLAGVNAGYPTWSRDGKHLYVLDQGRDEQAILRLRISDRKLERVVSLKDVPQPPTTFGRWIGLDPAGAPLALRDLSTQEIYAFDWQAP